jgi:hypothetical protein
VFSSVFILSPAELAARLIDAIAINETKPVESGLLKRRRWGRGWIIWVGNIFLKLSHSRIVMFPEAEAWQAWECASYRLLYDEECIRVDSQALLIRLLPGWSLRYYLETNELTPAMFVAAAQEFRRGHALEGWSHGDPHLANVLYDGQQAWLIDFETRHDPSLSTPERHADDLLVLLLDLIGRDSTSQWREWSKIFLVSYSEHTVLAALRQRLHMPTRFELILL